MNKIACRYALIQFMPYTETGEFANIGVLLVCPQTGFFGFKLETGKYQRYTDFFKELTKPIYREATRAIEAELKRLQQTLVAANPDIVLNTFTAAIHPREAMIRFGEQRGRLVDAPAKALDDLFNHYVEFGFLREQSPEQKLETRVQDLLKNFNLVAPFREGNIGAENGVWVRLPLIQTIENKQVKAIKPLYLGQKYLNEVYNHGEQWIGKLKRLRKTVGWNGKLLVTVNGLAETGEFKKAQDEVIAELKSLVTVHSIDTKNEIEKFCLQ
jgi:hypothetical protein